MNRQTGTTPKYAQTAPRGGAAWRIGRTVRRRWLRRRGGPFLRLLASLFMVLSSLPVSVLFPPDAFGMTTAAAAMDVFGANSLSVQAADVATPSATPTATAGTPTAAATETATGKPTTAPPNSSTAVATGTPTATPAGAATAVSPSTPTATATNTPTAAAAAGTPTTAPATPPTTTATNTPTATATSTVTAIATSTPTAAATSTPTAEPTSTPTEQPSSNGGAYEGPREAEAPKGIGESPKKPDASSLPGGLPPAAPDGGSGSGGTPAVEGLKVYNVNDTDDEYDINCIFRIPFQAGCTLRKAVVMGNYYDGGAIINLPAGVYQITTNESERDPDISGIKGDYLIWTPITINGAGAGKTIIEAGDNASSAVNRLFTVADTGSLTLNGVTLRNSKSQGKSWGSVIQNFGSVTLNDSEVYSSSSVGAVIANMDQQGSPAPSMTILRSTIADTTPGPGGTVHNGRGTMTIINSTISGNSNNAVVNYGTTTILNSTIAGNSGSGVLQATGSLTLQNTLIANNTYSNCSATQKAPITSTGHNLSSDGSCGFVYTGGYDGVDPKLGPLQDNGGTTRTRAPLPGSAALDAGDNAGCAAGGVAGIDQRKSPRPRPADLACDIGAFELDGATGSKLAVAVAIPDGGLTVNQKFSVTVQAQNGGNQPIPLPAAPINFTLSVGAGTGALNGPITGQIPAGANSVTISGLSYNVSQPGVVLRAIPATGSLVAGFSASFEVLPVGFIKFIDVSPPNPLLARTFSITVGVEDKKKVDRPMDAASAITLSLKTGTG
ncbi:MAG: right-handed parallel beta-helix repeat-containing protein, partial [Chloroflexi bacterium]|nr:right-handed parallel beta-helix repeat-containing protein [Chloroflexota bacterium]